MNEDGHINDSNDSFYEVKTDMLNEGSKLNFVKKSPSNKQIKKLPSFHNDDNFLDDFEDS